LGALQGGALVGRIANPSYWRHDPTRRVLIPPQLQ
jgi:hypothetical protein